MINYSLPTSAEFGDVEYEIRPDFRAALDILTALSDPELSDTERASVLLGVFYVDEIQPEYEQDAIDYCLWFLNGGKEGQKSGPKLMDWEQDFDLYCPCVNHVLGTDIRDPNTSIHWWTFLSAYMEIDGDSTFSQVVSIRDKKSRGKKLDKSEQEWLSRNRNLVDFKRKYTAEEDEFIKQWT